MKDYICIVTWDPLLEKVCYRYVHRSVKDHAQYAKSLHPLEKLFE